MMELFRDLLINVTDFFRDLDAAKYGALSKRRGRVLLKWSGEGDVFTLAWHEKDGPPVQKPEPTASGFPCYRVRSATGLAATSRPPSIMMASRSSSRSH
ncbi:MAG: hypothetical protein E5V57_28915 [Mesorhizobium sp.]|nr:MAG: hypothetical protein E5V57_28915 [Mesorhizobium sp.]